jgi:hypothetical protein
VKVGAIGVSGDPSCTDHAVAWRIRALRQLDHVPAGFHTGLATAVKGDELQLETGGADTTTANQTQQPTCANAPAAIAANGVIADQD